LFYNSLLYKDFYKNAKGCEDFNTLERNNSNTPVTYNHFVKSDSAVFQFDSIMFSHSAYFNSESGKFLRFYRSSSSLGANYFKNLFSGVIISHRSFFSTETLWFSLEGISSKLGDLVKAGVLPRDFVDFHGFTGVDLPPLQLPDSIQVGAPGRIEAPPLVIDSGDSDQEDSDIWDK